MNQYLFIVYLCKIAEQFSALRSVSDRFHKHVAAVLSRLVTAEKVATFKKNKLNRQPVGKLKICYKQSWIFMNSMFFLMLLQRSSLGLKEDTFICNLSSESVEDR